MNGKMILCSVVAAIAFWALYVGYVVWQEPERLTMDEQMTWAVIFGVGTGVSVFCLLKAYRQMSGKERPFLICDHNARCLLRAAQWVAMVAWFFLMLYSVAGDEWNFFPWMVLLPVIIVLGLFAAAVIVQRHANRKINRFIEQSGYLKKQTDVWIYAMLMLGYAVMLLFQYRLERIDYRLIAGVLIILLGCLIVIWKLKR